MSTATINHDRTEEATALSPLAILLNKHLETQPTESPLDRLDRCDRCPSAAQSTFTFPITPEKPGDNDTAEVMLCAHHTRLHLNVLLGQKPLAYWIEPSALWSVRGVTVPTQDHRKAGDGLTDS